MALGDGGSPLSLGSSVARYRSVTLRIGLNPSCQYYPTGWNVIYVEKRRLDP